jgi:hypothetical protein
MTFEQIFKNISTLNSVRGSHETPELFRRQYHFEIISLIAECDHQMAEIVKAKEAIEKMIAGEL